MNRPARPILAVASVAAIAAAAAIAIPLSGSASGGAATATSCTPELTTAAAAQTKVDHAQATLKKAERAKAKGHRAKARKAAAVARLTAHLAADEATLTAAESAVITCQGSLPTPTATVTTTVAPTMPAAVLAVVGDTACEPDDTDNAANPQAVKCDGFSIGENPASASPAPTTSQSLGMAGAYATVDEIEGWNPQALALLGDEQYQVGKLSDFEQSYDKTYGALKWLTKPAPGNHEYYGYTKKGDSEAAQNGTGYFSYFNGTDANGQPRAAGQAGTDTPDNQGWYSYDLGNWHIISLNAECGSTAFGGTGSNGTAATCDPTQGLAKTETAWLTSDLAADTAKCTIAYWHQPTFTASSAGGQEGSELGEAWWKLLYAHGHAIVLNGHEHLYARFQPMDPTGNVDTKKGIPEFIVGTGGEALDTLSAASSDVNTVTGHNDGTALVTGQDKAYGAMKMTLNPNGSYSWDYEPSSVPQGGSATALSYSDKGSATC